VREDGERLKAEGFSVIAVDSRRGSFSPWRGLRDFFQVFKIVRDERADIVHCIALRPVVIGGIVAKHAWIGALVVAGLGISGLRTAWWSTSAFVASPTWSTAGGKRRPTSAG
jgi:hypothetical protein